MDIIKTENNLAQFFVEVNSGDLKLESKHRLRFEITRQSVLEFFNSWEGLNHLLGNLEPYQIDGLAAVNILFVDFKKHEKVLAFTKSVMVFMKKMNPATILEFSSLCFFVFAEFGKLSTKYRDHMPIETPVKGVQLSVGKSLSLLK